MAQVKNAPASRRKVPTRAALACLLAVAIGALLAFGLVGCGPKKVEVPDLVYYTSADAEQALTDAGLKLGSVTEQEDPEIKLGDLVIGQSVAPGTEVDEGSAIDIVVTKGPKVGDSVKVPDLTGMTVEEAEKALSDVLLIPMPGKSQYSDTIEPGRVCAQSAAPGTELKVIDTVTYNVSLGKEKVAVPDVTGKTLDEARGILAQAGLGCDTTTSYSDTVAKDSVISQSVKKDEQVDKGTVIVLEVSLGNKPAELVTVPSIISYNLVAAKATLESAGLNYTYTGDENGTVVAMNPAPGAQVNPGSTVAFELKAAEPSPSEPSDGGNADSGSGSGTISDEDARTLNMIDVDQMVWEYGLGELIDSSITQLYDGKWYWEVITKGSDDNDYRHYIGTDEKVYELDENGKLKKI